MTPEELDLVDYDVVRMRAKNFAAQHSVPVLIYWHHGQWAFIEIPKNRETRCKVMHPEVTK